MNRARSSVRILVAILLLSGARPASTWAAETQWWVANSAADHVRSEALGVLVDPDGVLRAAPRTRVEPIDSLTVAWSLAVLRDGSVAVGGDGGRIMRWSPRSGWSVWARLGGGQVLALAADGDGVVAGTGPRGLVYRIAANGDTTRLATTGERYVWALASAGKNAWYAATGTRGRLLRLADGRVTTVLDTPEGNLVSLVADGRGGVYAGGDTQGRIVHVAADGVARTLYDATEDEIRALAMGPDGTVWASALTSAAASSDDEETDGPQPSKSPGTGGRAVLYRLTPEGQAVLHWVSPQPMIYALLAREGRVLAGTGNRAGVFEVVRAHGASQWTAPAAGQVTALAAGPQGGVLAITSNPATLLRFAADPAEGGTLTAAVLDARRFARFGRLRAEREGAVGFETRTGNSDTPDTTWSPWRAVAGDGAIGSPSARYLQWRVRLGSTASRVDEVAVSYREANLPPRVDEPSVAPQGQGFREGEMSPRSESVTQTLTGGQKVEYNATLNGSKPLREMPIWARGLRTLQWRAVDPNGDALRYDVFLRSEPAGPWIRIGEELESSLLTWNTNTLADGRYRVRVVASDAPGNALGEALTAEATSEPFAIDNTLPQVLAFTAESVAKGVRVRGTARDGEGVIARFDLSTDDGEWQPVSPIGGLADAPELGFDVMLTDLEPGPHLVSLRVVDQAGNALTRALQITVPGTR